MSDPAALEKVFPGETVSGNRQRRVRDNIPDFCRRLGGNPFVGVQNEHPGQATLINWQTASAPRIPPARAPGKPRRPKSRGNPDGIIRTARSTTTTAPQKRRF